MADQSHLQGQGVLMLRKLAEAKSLWLHVSWCNHPRLLIAINAAYAKQVGVLLLSVPLYNFYQW